MTCYNGMAARNYAHEEGLLQRHDDARDSMITQYVADQLAAIKNRPLTGSTITDNVNIFRRFNERHTYTERLDLAMCRMLAYMANVDDEQLGYLRTVSSELADAAMLIRDDVSDMLGEEAAGHLDGGGEI